VAWLGSILVAITWFRERIIPGLKNIFLNILDNLKKQPFTVAGLC
jgi:hypothetical protein